MNFARELYNKLDSSEWSRAGRYIQKAQEYYDAERYSDAREALLDAVAVCAAAGEN